MWTKSLFLTSKVAALSAGAVLTASAALAVEGGTGAYLLGSRDTLAGVVPPPGFYLGNDFVSMNGSVENIAIGGIPVFGADSDVFIYKLSLTQVFDATLWGGTPALNLNIPYADAALTFTGPFAGGIEDSETGLGDVTLTGLVGWHEGPKHWSVGLSVYAPVGGYDTATIDLLARRIDAVSLGKNVWSVQPVVAGTYLDPSNGREFSGAASILFSERNDATDYQTAPQLNLEAAVLQHLPSGLAFGLQGYVYEQLGDDSGAGAETIKLALGAESLQARVYGIGPMVTFSGKVFGKTASFKLKYTHEFGAKRRFESDVLWLNAGFAF